MISKLLAAVFVFLCIEYTYQQQSLQKYNQCYALANIDYYGNDLPCKFSSHKLCIKYIRLNYLNFF